MRITRALIAGLGLCVVGVTQVAAEAKIYPYASSHNYCPAGLQPVTISGVICCGTPNQSMTYQQVLMHPVAKKKKRHHHVKRKTYHKPKAHCEVGSKGCTFD